VTRGMGLWDLDASTSELGEAVDVGRIYGRSRILLAAHLQEIHRIRVDISGNAS